MGVAGMVPAEGVIVMDNNPKPINVMAALETTDACLHQLTGFDPFVKSLHISRLTQARAAIEELFNAAEPLTNALDDTGLRNDITEGMRSHEAESLVAAMRRLRRAINNARGVIA